MRLKSWPLLAAVALGVAALLFGIHWYRHRFVRSNASVVRLLPPGDLNLIYADLELMRRASLLGLLANIKVAPDQQYADFVQETGFDYTRDLDSIVIGYEPAQTFMVGRGRFSWDRLEHFARRHQGTCQSDSCRVPATTPDRWVNFLAVQPDVLAVAISNSQTAADNLRPPGRRLQEQIPPDPVWARLSHSLLTNPAGLPLPLQIFAVSMQSADSATLTAQPSSIRLKAHFVNASTAGTAQYQLALQTRQFKTALQRENEQVGKASIAGLLTGGSFQVIGSDVVGFWPVDPELLRALQ